MRNKLSPRIFITISAFILLILGIAIILWYLKSNNGSCSNCGIISPVTIIFIGGIILLIGTEVVYKVYKQRVLELLENDIDIKNQMSIKFEEFLLQSREELKKEEDISSKVENKVEVEKFDDIDTVIVPVTYSISDIKKDGIYTCPSSRKFKERLQYIAFYKSKEIVGYGEISNNYLEEVDGILTFKIKKFIELTILHNDNYAFAQNKRYCKSADLIMAKTTSSLIY